MRLASIAALVVLPVAWGCAPVRSAGDGAVSEAPAPAPVAPAADEGAPKKEPPPPPPPAESGAEEGTLLEALRSMPGTAAEGAGLEDAAAWSAADWEDPAQLERLTGKISGRKVLRVATAGGSKGKACVVLDRQLALAETGKARLLVYNRGKEKVQLALALWFSPNFTYYESRPVELPPGKWSEPAFDVASADWKTASNGWKHTAALWKREDTRRVALVLYHGGKPAELLVEGLTLPTAAKDK